MTDEKITLGTIPDAIEGGRFVSVEIVVGTVRLTISGGRTPDGQRPDPDNHSVYIFSDDINILIKYLCTARDKVLGITGLTV